MAQQQPPQRMEYGTPSSTQQYDSQRGARPMQMGRGSTVGQQSGRGMDLSLEDALTGTMRLTLHDFVQAATVCEWCADQCIEEGSQMSECIRLCRDVADLAIQNVRFITRDSVFGPDVAQTFAYAAEECAQECAQHPLEHCQECASVLQRAADSTWAMLESLDTQSQGQGTQHQPQQ